ncbi:1-acyl-sn-glycerol-3-phosphate acyltransferase [Rhodococcus sp. 1168]|nr:1-acyl-sn-glycerol-3-phosphate acyltransferase [Rhodococcus sp. 1168]
MPSSPCGDRCIPRRSESIRRIGLVVRAVLALFAIGLLPLLILIGLLWPGVRGGAATVGARLLLTAVGIGLRVEDHRSDREASRTRNGSLVVAGHVSWADILVLTAIRPARFVARADLVDWPLLGLLARSMKVISIDRGKLRALPETVGQVSATLREGGSVIVFPEGTTWCGLAYGSFRPAMFQAAIDTETWVQPVRLRYVDTLRDRTTTSTCFVGDETIGRSIGRIFRLKGIVAEVALVAPQAPGNDRRDLARRCEASIRAGDVHDRRLHSIVESAGVDPKATHVRS